MCRFFNKRIWENTQKIINRDTLKETFDEVSPIIFYKSKLDIWGRETKGFDWIL